MPGDPSWLPPEERLFLPGPAGRLCALHRAVAPKPAPRVAALLCHPHPLLGGTMDNKLLYRLAKRLPAALGAPALRFNFRGTGQSAGAHDGGRGEVDDATAALDWLQARWPGVPLAVVGYSFGAVVGLCAGARHPQVRWLIGLGLPLQQEWSLEFLRETRRPRLFVHGEHDEFANGVELLAFVRELPGPVSVRLIPGADHLFKGVEDEAVAAVVRYLGDVTAPDENDLDV
jgi:alpha/beta superfamily hydrolase